MRFFIALSILIIFSGQITAQNKMNAIDMLEKVKTEGGAIVELMIDENGDTSFNYNMKPIVIYPRRVFKDKKMQKKYDKVVRNVKAVYPYSIIIKNIFVETEFVLKNMDSNKERKKYIDEKEKELKREFEDDIRNMTYSQGRILIKLVDRETKHTSYELVKHFKGNLSAFFWQSVAKVFQTDLKYEYDPEGTDKYIEEIVSLIENGQL
jgi:hypothetical protein